MVYRPRISGGQVYRLRAVAPLAKRAKRARPAKRAGALVEPKRYALLSFSFLYLFVLPFFPISLLPFLSYLDFMFLSVFCLLLRMLYFPSIPSFRSHQHATAFHPCLADTSCKCWCLLCFTFLPVGLSFCLCNFFQIPLFLFFLILFPFFFMFGAPPITLSTIRFVLTSFQISFLPFLPFLYYIPVCLLLPLLKRLM